MGFVSCHPAAISCRLGLQIPLLWLLHEVNWHMVLAAPSLTESSQGRPHGSCAPKTLIGKKDKRKRSWSAGALWFGCRGALSRMWGVQPKELCQGRRALHSPFPSSTFSWLRQRNTGITSSLGCVFEGYWKSTYLGQELRLASMAMVVGSEWVSRDREHLRIRDTQTPVWSRRSLLLYQHISPKERQEIIWETEDHI